MKQGERALVVSHYNREFVGHAGEVVTIQPDGFTLRLDVGGFVRLVQGRDDWEPLDNEGD